MSPAADLRFPSGELSGFTTAGVSGFQNLHPAAVVRELLQNALDAAREAGRSTARVRFEVEDHALDDIPGIAAYRDAFRNAVSSQEKLLGGALPSQARVVARAIEECLDAPRCLSLFVIDDGVGLDKNRMTALLADGLSDKRETGAFGNGHLAVVPASDLRYVLYGGRTADGAEIGSGHAILATHQDADGSRRGKDGYLVAGFDDNSFSPYVFAGNRAVSDYLRRKLSSIAEHRNGGAGTVVAVPGFNRFRDAGRTLWDQVARAAACNFFPAIRVGELVVEVVDGGEPRTLNGDSLDATLRQFCSELRNKFLSGSRAWSAFQTIANGEELIVDTPAGPVAGMVRETPDTGISRIDLCRNGMWITDDIPKLNRARFAEHRPFHCVLLIDARDGGEVHGLIRKAEGPLHNHLEARKWLDKNERQLLDQALDAVAAAIREQVGTIGDDSFRVPDVLSIDTHDIEAGGRRAAQARAFERLRPRGPRAKPGDEGETDDTQWPHPGNGTKEWRERRTRPASRPVPFPALAVPTAPRSCQVSLRLDETCPDAEVRFVLDESVDESCDQPGASAWILLTAVSIDGAPAPRSALTGGPGNSALGVTLGAFERGASRRIEFDFALPEGVSVKDDATVVLKAQVFRRGGKRADENGQLSDG